MNESDENRNINQESTQPSKELHFDSISKISIQMESDNSVILNKLKNKTKQLSNIKNNAFASSQHLNFIT